MITGGTGSFTFSQGCLAFPIIRLFSVPFNNFLGFELIFHAGRLPPALAFFDLFRRFFFLVFFHLIFVILEEKQKMLFLKEIIIVTFFSLEAQLSFLSPSEQLSAGGLPLHMWVWYFCSASEIPAYPDRLQALNPESSLWLCSPDLKNSGCLWATALWVEDMVIEAFGVRGISICVMRCWLPCRGKKTLGR